MVPTPLTNPALAAGGREYDYDFGPAATFQARRGYRAEAEAGLSALATLFASA